MRSSFYFTSHSHSRTVMFHCGSSTHTLHNAHSVCRVWLVARADRVQLSFCIRCYYVVYFIALIWLIWCMLSDLYAIIICYFHNVIPWKGTLFSMQLYLHSPETSWCGRYDYFFVSTKCNVRFIVSKQHYHDSLSQSPSHHSWHGLGHSCHSQRRSHRIFEKEHTLERNITICLNQNKKFDLWRALR